VLVEGLSVELILLNTMLPELRTKWLIGELPAVEEMFVLMLLALVVLLIPEQVQQLIVLEEQQVL
jgi:hypothetical protein